MTYWGDDMEFFLLAIGAIIGFMAGYLMGFCKADNMHHNIIHDRWIGGYTPTEPRQLTIDDLPKHDNGAGFYARNRPTPPMEGM